MLTYAIMFSRIFTFLLIIEGLTYAVQCISAKSVANNGGFADAEDGYLLVPALISKYGYPVETHTMTTTDGYILTLHRIPHGKNRSALINRGIVFVSPGLLSSSADFIISGTSNGLGYILADAGYDVWLSNTRGNRYARKHINMDPDKDAKKFWNFSWHEAGVIDLPEMIDYVLNATKASQLHHIGHSQGTTIFYVMCSEKPEYNHKVIAHISLAPSTFQKHAANIPIRVISHASKGLEKLKNTFGIYEMMRNGGLLHNMSKSLCADNFYQIICIYGIFTSNGFSMKQLNRTLLPIVLGHTPAGGSTKQFLHYAQEIKSGHFRQYDYGRKNNIEIYNQPTPPDYKLNNTLIPVYLFHGGTDYYAAEKDVEHLSKNLVNLRGKVFVAKDWNHLDYLLGIDAPKLVYTKILDILQSH